jgi:flagellar biosynthesis protein FlhG
MSDQAYRLRALMHAGEARAPRAAGAPRLLAIAGAKGGVGTTSVAVNLAIAFARDGRRALLVDTARDRADLAAQCGLADGPGVADVLAARRSLHEAIQLGPAGIQVLSGRRADGPPADWSAAAGHLLVRELRGLGPHADVVLLDVGAALDAAARHFWRWTDEIVLVTTPDTVAVMDAYAAVKTHCEVPESMRVAILINKSPDSQAAQDAQFRLQRACRRFLGIDVRTLGAISNDAEFGAAAALFRPLLVHAPASTAAQAVVRIAERLESAKADRRSQPGRPAVAPHCPAAGA